MGNNTKKRNTPQILVPVYFNPDTFTAICKDAASVEYRGVLLQPAKQKEHGFDGEITHQRKGVGPFLKFCWRYWKDDKTNRETKASEIKIKEQEIEAEKKKLGLVK
jgi:hypothetical protein